MRGEEHDVGSDERARADDCLEPGARVDEGAGHRVVVVVREIAVDDRGRLLVGLPPRRKEPLRAVLRVRRDRKEQAEGAQTMPAIIIRLLEL